MDYKREIQHVILYGLFGATCSALDFGVFTGLLKLGVYYDFANVLSVHVGIFCSYMLNCYFNFDVRDRKDQTRRFLPFYTVGLAGLFVSTGMLWLLVGYFQFNELLSKLASIVVVALLQFLLNRFVTFRGR